MQTATDSNAIPEAGKAPSIIVQQLVVRPSTRKSQDIDTWRNAMRSAEATNPRRVELYDLYDDILLDGHLDSVVEKRVLAITNADWQFVRDGKVIDLVNDMIDTPAFEELLRGIIDSKFWGYSMLELVFGKNGDFSVYDVPKKHMRPHLGIVAKEQTGDTGTNIREGLYLNTVLEVGKPKDLGKLIKAAQYVIYKRGSFGDWSQFAELFGMPFREGQYDGYDDAQRIQLEKALEEMGGAAYVVTPAGSSIKFHENKTNSNGELYGKLKDACNAELSKLILGQTMTTEDGSSKSQSETHKDVEAAINLADLIYVRRILNKRFVKILEANGIKTQGGNFSVKGLGEEKLTTEQKMRVIITLKTQGQLPVDDDFLYEEFGIPKPANYDQLKASATPPVPPAPAPDPEPEKPKRGRKKKLQADDLKDVDPEELLRLYNRLGSFFGKAPVAPGPGLKTDILYVHGCGCPAPSATFELAEDAGFAEMLNDFLKDIHSGIVQLGQIHIGYYQQIAKQLSKAVAEGLGGSTFGADNYKNTLKAYFDQNLYAFSAGKSTALLQELNGLLKDEAGELVSYGKFKKLATAKLEKYNRAHLQAEYNSAVASAQMADKWQTLKDFEKLEYRTVGDDHVRYKHQLLDKLVVATSDPLLDSIYPVKDFGCRCTMIPAEDDAELTDQEKLQGLIETQKTKPYFEKHVGKERVLFSEDGHPYFETLQDSGKRIASGELLATRHYNMPTAERIYEMSDKLPELTRKGKEATAVWWKDNAPGGELTLRGKDGVAWRFSEKNLVRHPDFLHHLPELLEQPDEVWCRRVNGRLHYTYLKYYEGKPVRATYDFEKDKWNIRAMSKTAASLETDVRRGQLKYRR